MVGMILTDAHGRPIPKPERAEYQTDLEFVQARHVYYDKIRAVAVEAFDREFRQAMKGE